MIVVSHESHDMYNPIFVLINLFRYKDLFHTVGAEIVEELRSVCFQFVFEFGFPS